MKFRNMFSSFRRMFDELEKQADQLDAEIDASFADLERETGDVDAPKVGETITSRREEVRPDGTRVVTTITRSRR